MKRALFILLALVLAAILAAAGLWLWRDRQARSFYTDGAEISRRIDEAFVREMLWQSPRSLGETVNSDVDEYEPRVSRDGSTLLLVRGKAGANADLFIATRDPVTLEWTEPQPLFDINTEHDELGPALSPDGRSLLFASDRPGSIGGYDLWLATRSDFGWTQPINVGPAVNSAHDEHSPTIGGPADGAMLLFASNRPAEGEAPTRQPGDWKATVRERYAASDYDLYAAALTPEGFETAVALIELNTPRNEGTPVFSPAGDFLYFCSDREGGAGGFDLYRSRRLDGQQLEAEALGGEINTRFNEMDPAPELGGFALVFSTDRPNDQPSMPTDAGTQPALEDQGYDLWRSESREVFVRVGPRAPMDFAALWAWLAPLLLWLLLLLLGILLLGLSWKGVRSHRLSLLVRCLLASVIAHLLLMILMTFWQVTTTIAQMVDRGSPTRIVLVGETGGGGLAGQLRGGVSGDLNLAPRETAASVKAERPEQSPGAQAELVEMGAQRAAAGQEDAAQLAAAMTEADDRHVESPRTDVQTYAAIQQPGASDVASPRDAQPQSSREAQAAARGEQAPRAVRSASATETTLARDSAASLAPAASPAVAPETVRVVATATESQTMNESVAPTQLPPSDRTMPVDAMQASTPDVAKPGEGERIATNERSGTTVATNAAAGSARTAVDTASGAAGARDGSAGQAVALSPQQGDESVAETAVAINAQVPGDSSALSTAKSPPTAVASTLVNDAGESPSSGGTAIALPADAAAASGGGSTEAGAVVSASDARGATGTGRAADVNATARPSIGDGDGQSVQSAVVSVSAATESVSGTGVRSVGDSTNSGTTAAAGATAPGSATALDSTLDGGVATGDAALALPRDVAIGGAGAVAAGATSQPGVSGPASALAQATGRRDGATGAVDGFEQANSGMVAMSPGVAAAGRSEGADPSSVARGSASARDSAGAATSPTAAPGSDRALGLDDGGAATSLAAGPIALPGDGVDAAAGSGAASEQAVVSGPVAAGVASGRSESAGDAGTFSASGESSAVALAPDRGGDSPAGSSHDGAPSTGLNARDALANGSSGATAPPSDRTLGLDDDSGFGPPMISTGEVQLPGSGEDSAHGGPNAGRDAGPELAASGSTIGRSRDAGDASTFAPKSGTNSIALAPDRQRGGSGEDARDASTTSVTGMFSDADALSGSTFAPIAAAVTDLSVPDAAPGSDLGLKLPTDLAPSGSPYSARKEDTRMETVKQMGGSEDTEKAVALALEWLARHQSPDGRWATRAFDEQCNDCEGEGKFDTDIATTGLALLCFLGADHHHLKQSKYQANVDRGLKWLLSHQEPDGDLRGGETMYSHGIASIAIAESLGMSGDPRLRDPVRRAIEFIDAARNRNTGGWRYEPRQAGDTSVAGWQVMALMSAKRAGEATPDECFAAASDWMEQVNAPNRPGRYAYQPGQPASPSMTAEGLFIQQLLGVPRTDERMMGSVAYILENLPRWDEAANTYYWYYATLAMFQHQGPAWEKWNSEVTRVLLQNQRRSGAASGSWDPQDNWSKIGGRVYQTAICTLCLEVYYRYLPMYKAPLLADARGAVGGVVTDSRSGLPIAGAMVRLDMSTGAGALVATTDSEGRYALALPDLPADFVALSASMENYTPATTNISKAEATAAAGGQITHDFKLDPMQSSVIALEDDPQVHHLGNDEFEGAINSQFQKAAEGTEFQDEFTLGPQHLPPRVQKAEVVLMFKGAQAMNSIFINERRIGTRMNGSPDDGSFGEFRVEIPLGWLQEGVNTILIRSSSSAGDLDDFEFVNVQIQFDAQPKPEPETGGDSIEP